MCQEVLDDMNFVLNRWGEKTDKLEIFTLSIVTEVVVFMSLNGNKY